MLFAADDIVFSLGAIGIITVLGGMLTATIVYLFKLLIEAKDTANSLKLKDEREESLKLMARELLENLEAVAVRHAKAEGKTMPAMLAPVVGEHSSPMTEEQKATAELQTLRARAAAAVLLLDLPPRNGEGLAPKSDEPTRVVVVAVEGPVDVKVVEDDKKG